VSTIFYFSNEVEITEISSIIVSESHQNYYHVAVSVCYLKLNFKIKSFIYKRGNLDTTDDSNDDTNFFFAEKICEARILFLLFINLI